MEVKSYEIYRKKSKKGFAKDISPADYVIYVDIVKLVLPEVIRNMFVIGFKKALMGCKISQEESDILLRGYNDLMDQGYFTFEAEGTEGTGGIEEDE